MKSNEKKIFLIRIMLVPCIQFFFANLSIAQVYFIEDSSNVVVEMESIGDLNGWTIGETIDNVNVIKYLSCTGVDYFKFPGNQILEYKLKINNPGTYRFIWNSKVGKGESPTEHNDTWLRIPDALDFYSDKSGHILFAILFKRSSLYWFYSHQSKG